jgi:hypothetical protein
MKGVVGAIAWVCCAVLLALAAWAVHGQLTRTISIISLAAGLIPALLAARSVPRAHFSPHWWEVVTMLIFVLFGLRAFCWVLFKDGNDWRVLSSNNLGDISLHITYINYFANGASFWPKEPIFPSVGLHYPIGIDLFNSLLLLGGVDLSRGLVWVGLGGALATLVALYQWGRGFVVAGFLFNGGVAGFEILRSWKLTDFQSDLSWKSLALSMFVPQRGMLFALPAGLLLLASWRSRFFSKDSDGWKLPLWVEVILYAGMPIFHLHTFIALSICLGCWLIVVKRRRDILIIIGAAIVPATVLVALMTDNFQSHSVIHWAKEWAPERTGFVVYWLKNFGLWPVFAIITIVILAKRRFKDSEAIGLLLPATFIFLLGTFVILTAWSWDNIKLMMWAYLIVLPLVWQFTLKPLNPWIQGLCCAGLFFSGFVTLLGGIDSTHRGYGIATRSELDGVVSALKRVPVSDVIAGHPTYNHPVLLSGHCMVMGYDGHLWSHGLDFKKTEDELKMVLSGSDDWVERAKKLNAKWLFWGSRESEANRGSTMPWLLELAPAQKGEWGSLYRLAN